MTNTVQISIKEEEFENLHKRAVKLERGLSSRLYFQALKEYFGDDLDLDSAKKLYNSLKDEISEKTSKQKKVLRMIREKEKILEKTKADEKDIEIKKELNGKTQKEETEKIKNQKTLNFEIKSLREMFEIGKRNPSKLIQKFKNASKKNSSLSFGKYFDSLNLPRKTVGRKIK